MLSWLSANRDQAVFDRPDEVVLDRAANPHLAFGVGTHRCIGMHMARTMFQVLLSEVLTRIPDYAVDHDATRFYAGNPGAQRRRDACRPRSPPARASAPVSAPSDIRCLQCAPSAFKVLACRTCS